MVADFATIKSALSADTCLRSSLAASNNWTFASDHSLPVLTPVSAQASLHLRLLVQFFD